MKRKKVIAFFLVFSLLLSCSFATASAVDVSNAPDNAASQAVYTPRGVYYDYENGVAKAPNNLNNLGDSTSYKYYIADDVNGNKVYTLAPGFTGTQSGHTYLSYRDDVGGDGLIYTGADVDYNSPYAKDCETSFVTLDFDIGAQGSLPDYMSVSLNARGIKEDATNVGASSPEGNLFIGFNDKNGTLAISTNNDASKNAAYKDTGIDISREFAHISLVLDLRPVISASVGGKADLIKAYLYVNGKFFSEMEHGFNARTDYINEIRLELTPAAVATETDVVMFDNVRLRQFDKDDYIGNLGSVLADTTKSLSEFDYAVYNTSYVMPKQGVIGKIGPKEYYSVAEMAEDVKSGDTVRFFVPKSQLIDISSIDAFSGTTVNYMMDVGQNDGAVFDIYGTDGALISTNKGTVGTELASAIAGKTGTVEFYRDYTSTSALTSVVDNAGVNPSGKITLSLNGNTLTEGVSNWFAPASKNGNQYLDIVGPGSFVATTGSAFNIGAGAPLTHVNFKSVDISGTSDFIVGQIVSYAFEDCDITWTTSDKCFVNAGGPSRGSDATISFRGCNITHEGTPSGVDVAFIAATTISTSNTEVGIANNIIFNDCIVDMPDFNLFSAKWNTSVTPNAAQPDTSVTISNSKIDVASLVTSYTGCKVSVEVKGESDIKTNSKIANLSTVGSDGSVVAGGKTYYNSMMLKAEKGTTWSVVPKNNSRLSVDIKGGNMLPLENGEGYVVAKPDVKANLSLGSDFDFNFYVQKENYVSAAVNEEELTLGDTEMLGGKEYVTVSYDEIEPARAAVPFTARIAMTDGRSTYIASYPVSVSAYLKTVLTSAGETTDIARAKELAASMVKYIDTTYDYFEASDGADEIAELLTLIEGMELADVDIAALESVNTMSEVSFAVTASQINLLSTPKVRFTLNPEYSGTINVNGENFTVENGGCNGNTYIEIDVPAKQITNPVTVTADGRSGSFSVAAYYNYLGENNLTDAQGVLQALINYGAEAAEYVPHVFDDKWISNNTHHWHPCTDTNCGATKDYAEHSYDEDGLCVCGHIYNFGNGEGEFLAYLGLSETVKTGRDDMKFAKVMEAGSAAYSFTEEEKAAAKTGDMMVFSFVVRADKATKLSLNMGLGTNVSYKTNSQSIEYTVPYQWTRIYVPVENNGMEDVTLTAGGKIYIAEAKYENLGDTDIMDIQQKSGMWMLDEFESVTFTKTSGIPAGGTMAIEKRGNYIFSIGGGKFKVSDVTTNQVVATLTGFGTVRQMGVTEDGRYAVITGRQNGVYIVSLENPTSPEIISSYNAIEQATGLCVSGDYAIVGNRQYGLEIVDISDPYHPVHKGKINANAEVQSCVVHDNILYAGVWGECGVYMYDLNQLTDTSFISTIGKVNNNGKGDGMTVIERDGKTYLFAATGQHTYDANPESSAQNLEFGQGNGMDIFDVTDPTNPKWLSTSKIDGRFYYTGNDFWETEVSYDAETGKWYAYLVNTYNGVYIFDVTDPAAPVRLARATIETPAGSSPALTHATRTILTPWDQGEVKRIAASSIAVDDGKIYIAGVESNIHIYETPYAFAHDTDDGGVANFDNIQDDFYAFDNVITNGTVTALNEESYTHIPTTGQALAVAMNGNYIYLAAGAEGIIILDKTTYERKGTITPVTENGRVGFMQDAKVYDNKLYVAEDIAGLRVYDIAGDNATEPELLAIYDEPSNGAVTQITVASDGNFAVLHMIDNFIRIIDTSSLSSGTLSAANFVIEENGSTVNRLSVTGGNMYHHNLSTLIADRYVAAWNHIGTEHWIDFGPSGARYDTPKVVSKGGTYTGSLRTNIGMQGGITHYADDEGNQYAIRLDGNKARLQSVFDSYTYTELFTAGTSGRPTVCGDYLFVNDRVYSNIAIHKIKDGTRIGSLKVKGDPDVAYADGSMLYIPLGYQGLLVVDVETAFSN